MMRWLWFLIAPVLLLCVLDFASVILLGGVVQVSRAGFWDLLASFLEYFLIGACIHAAAPRPSRALAVTYAVLLSSALMYLAASTRGASLQVLGATTILQPSWLKEGVRLAGLFLSVWLGGRPQSGNALVVRET